MPASTQLFFQVQYILTASPKVMNIKDLTNYSGVPLAQATTKIIFKIIDPNGTVIYANAGWDADDFSSPDIDRNSTDTKNSICQVSVDVDNIPVSGEYEFYAKYSDSAIPGVVYTMNNTYDFEYISPLGDIVMSVDYRTAILTSDDQSSYAVIDGENPGTPVSPSSIVRSHTILQPNGGGMNPVPGTTTDKKRQIGGGNTEETQLWTGQYQTTVVASLFYDLNLWNGQSWITVTDQVTGYESIEVTKQDEFSTLYTLLQKLEQRRIQYQNAGPSKKYNEVLEAINFVSFFYSGYEWAKMSGLDYSDWIAKIQNTLETSIGITIDDDLAPQPVAPYGYYSGGGASAGGSKILYGTTAPSDVIGNNDDTFIVTMGGSAGNVYKKVAGSWVLQFNITGPAGANGSSYPSIIYGSYNDSDAEETTNTENLKIAELPANTLANNKEKLIIHALYELNLSSSFEFKIDLLIGAIVLADITIPYMPNRGRIELFAEITRISDTQVIYMGKVFDYGSDPVDIYQPRYAKTNLTFNSIQTVYARSKKEAVGVAGDITCLFLEIKKEYSS